MTSSGAARTPEVETSGPPGAEPSWCGSGSTPPRRLSFGCAWCCRDCRNPNATPSSARRRPSDGSICATGRGAWSWSTRVTSIERCGASGTGTSSGTNSWRRTVGWSSASRRSGCATRVPWSGGCCRRCGSRDTAVRTRPSRRSGAHSSRRVRAPAGCPTDSRCWRALSAEGSAEEAEHAVDQELAGGGPTVLMALALELQVVHRPVEGPQGSDDLQRLAEGHVGVELAVHDEQRHVDVLGVVQR